MLPNKTYTRSHSQIRRAARRWLRWRYRNFRPEGQGKSTVRVAGIELQVLPDVFNPALHFTSTVFARYIQRKGTVSPDSTVLDLGTGSGLLALSAALSGAKRVVAVDINPAAVACAEANLESHGLQEVVEVVEGDGFGAASNERFDLVVCNPPYFRGEPKNMASRAFHGGEQLEWFTKFGNDLHAHLKPDGYAIISLGDAAEIDTILELLRECGWQSKEIVRRDIIVEIIYLFKLTPGAAQGALA